MFPEEALPPKEKETELATFLCEAEGDNYYPLFLTLARAGLRPGEAIALKWDDFNFSKREILIERALSDGAVGPTKTGKSRIVDMSLELRETLIQLYVHREKQTLRYGWSEMPEYVFIGSRGALLDDSRLRRRFAAILRKAGLSGHTPYDLRHSFISLLPGKGKPITYVAAQAGQLRHPYFVIALDAYGCALLR